LNKQAVLEAVGDKNDALKAYIDQEKLDLKDTADVTKLLQYYDTL
jgi:hypothetical protein